MRFYRILENTLTNGNKEFIPEYKDMNLDLPYGDSGFYLYDWTSFISVSTYEMALEIIEHDKKSHVDVEKTIIHYSK